MRYCNDVKVTKDWTKGFFDAYNKHGIALYQPKFVKMTEPKILDGTGNMINLYGFRFARGKGEIHKGKYQKIETLFPAFMFMIGLSTVFLIMGLDNMNGYYDISLKDARLKKLLTYNNFKFLKADIVDNGDCWDFIYGHSRWETACKCEALPQETLDLTTSYINATYSKG